MKRFYNQIIATLLTTIFCIFWGCGGGGGGSSDSGGLPGTNDDPPADTWQQVNLKQLDAGGLLSPRAKATGDNDGNIHVAYFSDSQSPETTYAINYLVKNIHASVSPTADGQETIIGVDNCKTLDFALDQNNLPVVAYQGGVVRECGSEQESDAMLSIKESGTWEEYTGATGEVERNPVFTDGLAGTEVSVAFDSLGNVHLSYQFFYEGCDAMNFKYPDLCYVKKDRTALDDNGIVEETVEGNQYGTTNIQNSVGAHNKILLDSHDNPVIFYYAVLEDNSRGLRVARKGDDGLWQKEWIEEGCEIGGISAGFDADGFLAVAYYVKQYTNGKDDRHCLRYAKEQTSSWQVQMVDDTTLGGEYPSLAFDSSGFPAIAYYELESHSGYTLENLKLARFNGLAWERDVVASAGNIGRYNSLWFDNTDVPYISTYSDSNHTIYLFHQ